MLFNSLEYLFFLPVVFILYWTIFEKNLRYQNLMLLVASYFFYGWWSWKFLCLLLLSTILDFAYGFGVASKNRKRSKQFLWLSIINNLGILAIFKYYNFFIAQFQTAFSFLGVHIDPFLLNIALPVGISFYTFHGLSYVFDIYRGVQQPVKNFIDYAVFVCFFPLLVAGPIERANHLLPQIQKIRQFDLARASIGLRLILWGIFKKVVVADNSAYFANEIFNNYTNYNGSAVFLGSFFFAIQIYCDFSGYSDIAIGSANLFGFDLLKNFKFPYFSRDIAEFWKRWHISLSSWFRDYLYIPLGGSKQGKLITVRNTFIIFLVSGFWHGASWNFIAWGTAHALGFMPLFLLSKNKINTKNAISENSIFPSIRELRGMITTFLFVQLCWIFFRAPSLDISFNMLGKIFSFDFFAFPNINTPNQDKLKLLHLILAGLFLFIAEWHSRTSDISTQFLDKITSSTIRWAIYISLTIMIVYFKGAPVEFIYFAF